MKNGRTRWMYIGGAILVVASAAYVLTTRNGAKAGFDASRLATIERGTMVKSVVATGKIEPIAKVEIKSKANGIIEALRYDVGAVVTTGDVLAELDKEQLAARLREEEANLQAAEANLTAARAQLEKNTIEAESPDLEFARRAYDRGERLYAEKLYSQSQLDDLKSARDVAENKQRSAKGQLIVSRARVEEAAAKVAQARAAVARAAEELRNATIRAPINGTVLSRDVELGSPVSSILNMGAAATLVMTLGDINSVFVRGKVDEADIGRVRLGMPARITVETFKDKAFEGKVTQISPIGVEKDNVTTFEVEVSIQNPGNELKANMTANAEIILEEHPNSLIVPEAAITYDAERTPTVDLVDPAAPEGHRKVKVKTGIGNGTKTQVLDGVKPGDKVVLPS
ncbi:MAG: efflux RND transporter periplasmic adaptor subunit [Acidobacteria bacterium]|jgi:HlyD family secretion protein|nr:efflux RND transporter periplasmic adaptor subunit [Acidobacteriota bacterium]